MKIINLITATIIIISVYILPLDLPAEESKPGTSANPQELALLFLRLDLNGARLSSESYEKSGIANFTMPGEYKSPGWDSVVIIKKYEVKNISQTDDQSTIAVEYDVIGSLSDGLTIKRQTESYSFRFKQEGQRWFMVEPYDLCQHISIDTAISHSEGLIRRQGDSDGTKKVLIQELRQLAKGLNN